MIGTASALVAPGAIVAGKYRLDSVIGEGGMGSVWAATHTGLGQQVAIKFISKEFVTSVEALRRFDAEAKAAAQLRSRHVVQVFDNGALEDGTPYIAMELLRGENVYARVHRGGPVPLPEAIEIVVQCCKALGKAHGAGIIHRDIKPDNIFLAQSEDEAILVKVLDFGIAKFANGPNDHGSTRTGAVLGTPLYMSPEQARGLKSIDHRTDLYSLGLVAYTMLTGNLAFSSESFGDLLLQICTAPLPSLCANAPWLPAGVEGWFQRACAREPQNRFSSAVEFAEGLRAACDGAYRASSLPMSAMPGSAMPGSGLPAAGTPMSLTPGNAPQQGGSMTPITATNPAHAVSAGTGSGMSRSGDLAGGPAVAKSRGPLYIAVGVALVGGIAAAALVGFGKKEPAASAGAATTVSAPPAATTLATNAGAGAAVTATATATTAAVLTPPPVPVETGHVAPPPAASSAEQEGAPHGQAGSQHEAHGVGPHVVPPVAPPAHGAPQTPPTAPPAQGSKSIDLGY